MPTYAQLQSEAAWNQEIVTDELKWLVNALCDHFGVPRSNGGTKGNNLHVNGGHRSQRWCLASRYSTSRTYSIEAGLAAAFVNDIAAFDVTLPLAHMLTISRNADRATRAGVLEELVEWFGNVNGDQRVDGWNNIENRVASSDSSHLWHFHGRVKRALLRDMATMRRIFAALTGTGDDMQLSDESPWTKQYNPAPKVAPELPGPWLGGHVGDQLQYMRETTHFTYLLTQQLAQGQVAFRVVVEQLAAVLTAGGGSVDTAAILAGVDERLAKLAAEQRDAVADLGEGGAAQVRAAQS